MNQIVALAKVFVVVIFLTSCATNEYRSVESGCEVEAQRLYPPKLQNYLVTKKKQIEVGDGTFRCTSKERPASYSVGNAHMETITDCQEGKKYIDKEYTVRETEDLNEDTRRNFVNQCASSKCVQLYGNHLCKTSKSDKVSVGTYSSSSTDVGRTLGKDCQTHAECGQGQSCRSKKGGGAECR